eukprot:gb/GEZN01010415.1/.p1 GENE.gb/GEZN01010415.1/~~gb/GEZN01010415.1/.p1  ORF type:complete len:303 (-),score=28.94 gb/GEZN01010415.1/:187-1095(-)
MDFATPHVFSAEQVGIKDIDGYGHVWYGNYLKQFERGACTFLGGGSVRCVEHLKYKKSVPWGAEKSRIETYLIEHKDNSARVYQRWMVGEDEKGGSEMALLIAEIALNEKCKPVGTIEVTDKNCKIKAGAKFGMAVIGLVNSAIKPCSPSDPSMGRMLVYRTVYQDMLINGRLSTMDQMDLFEQTRTEMVGGQRGLKAFLANGKAMVVGRIDRLDSQPGPAGPMFTGAGDETVECEVEMLREYAGRRCVDFQQRIRRKTDKAEVASIRVLMCCVQTDKEELTPIPEEYWKQWLERLASWAHK